MQVYRALEKLLDYGLIHRLESLNAFVACAHPQCHQQGLVAFAICEKCGQVTEFSDAAIENLVTAWSVQNGFKSRKTTLELRGICEACDDHESASRKV